METIVARAMIVAESDFLAQKQHQRLMVGRHYAINTMRKLIASATTPRHTNSRSCTYHHHQWSTRAGNLVAPSHQPKLLLTHLHLLVHSAQLQTDTDHTVNSSYLSTSCNDTIITYTYSQCSRI